MTNQMNTKYLKMFLIIHSNQQQPHHVYHTNRSLGQTENPLVQSFITGAQTEHCTPVLNKTQEQTYASKSKLLIPLHLTRKILLTLKALHKVNKYTFDIFKRFIFTSEKQTNCKKNYQTISETQFLSLFMHAWLHLVTMVCFTVIRFIHHRVEWCCF